MVDINRDGAMEEGGREWRKEEDRNAAKTSQTSGANKATLTG